MSDAGGDRNNVRFRPRHLRSRGAPDDAAHSRFVHGAILFVAVALLYPWYSYRVQSRLMEADMARALAAADVEMRRLAEAKRGRMARSRPSVRKARSCPVPQPMRGRLSSTPDRLMQNRGA